MDPSVANYIFEPRETYTTSATTMVWLSQAAHARLKTT